MSPGQDLLVLLELDIQAGNRLHLRNEILSANFSTSSSPWHFKLCFEIT